MLQGLFLFVIAVGISSCSYSMEKDVEVEDIEQAWQRYNLRVEQEMFERKKRKLVRKAISVNDPEKVKEIVLKFSHIDFRWELLCALRYHRFYPESQEKIINVLIEHGGANINCQDDKGRTCLHDYLVLAAPKAVQFLFTIPNINPTLRCKVNDDTPIDRAFRIESPSCQCDILKSIRLITKHILTKRMEHYKKKSDLLQAVEKMM